MNPGEMLAPSAPLFLLPLDQGQAPYSQQSQKHFKFGACPFSTYMRPSLLVFVISVGDTYHHMRDLFGIRERHLTITSLENYLKSVSVPLPQTVIVGIRS